MPHAIVVCALHVAAEGVKTVSRSNQSRSSGEGVLVEDPGVMNADSSRFEVEPSLERRSPFGEVPLPQTAVRTADSGMKRSHDPLSRLFNPFQLEQSVSDSARCLNTSEILVDAAPKIDDSADAAESSGASASNGDSEFEGNLLSQLELEEPPSSLLSCISASPSAIRALKGPTMSLEMLSADSESGKPRLDLSDGSGGNSIGFDCHLTDDRTVIEPQRIDMPASPTSPVREPIPTLAPVADETAIAESSTRVSCSFEDTSRIEGQVIDMDDLQLDTTLNPSVELSGVGESELESLESELFNVASLAGAEGESVEGESVEVPEMAEPAMSTNYGPAVVKDYCAGELEGLGNPEWMDFQPSLLSDDELAAIYTESLEAMSELLSDALQDDIVEDAVSAGNEFQLELADAVMPDGLEEDSSGTVEPEMPGQAEPAVVDTHSFTPPSLETAHQAAMQEFAEQPEPNRRQEMQTEMHGLRGQIDILELREEKLHLQMNNFVNEIDQLNEQNVLLEKLVQELPDLYRKKFHDRMKPIKERIARIQEENLRLHADIDWLTQKLAANVLPPAPEERRLIKLPSFGRRLPLLPDAVGQ
ncbi:MAG: hypothetical protein AB4050_14865 [Synechococcus sp.]